MYRWTMFSLFQFYPGFVVRKSITTDQFKGFRKLIFIIEMKNLLLENERNEKIEHGHHNQQYKVVTITKRKRKREREQ